MTSFVGQFALVTLAAVVLCEGSVAGQERRPIDPDTQRPVDAPLSVRSDRPTFPVSVGSTGRYLVDANGSPFRIQGDAAWSLIANLTREEANDYLDDRRAKGFNTLLVNLLEHRFAVQAPANRAGEAPFLKPGDFSTPNPAYFAFASEMIDAAATKGFLVLLDVMYLGADGGPEGFWTELNDPRNGKDACFEFGRYIGQYFGSKPNVVFVIGGDFTPPAGSEGVARLKSIVEGVKAAGASQIWTGHWGSGLSTDVRAVADLIDLQGAYPRGPDVIGDCRRAFETEPKKPAFLLEAGYEDESWKPGDPASIRRYEWSAMLGGCTAGVFYGHRDIWEFSTDTWSSGFAFGSGSWRRALDAPGAVAMQHMAELLGTVAWYSLIPAPPPATTRLGRTLESLAWYALTPGRAEHGRPFIASGLRNFAVAAHVIGAVSEGGDLLLAYRPPAHQGSFTVDMTVLSGPTRALWWDPTSGKETEIAAGLPNTGVRTFDPPGRNASGDNDWVLVLKAS